MGTARFVIGMASVVVATSVARPTLGFDLVEHSFDENVRASGLVVIGTAGSAPHQLDGDASGLSYVTIEIRKVLKGKSVSRLELLVTPNNVEWYPRCCKEGAPYLLLLRELGSGRFEAVNGHFGAIEIK